MDLKNLLNRSTRGLEVVNLSTNESAEDDIEYGLNDTYIIGYLSRIFGGNPPDLVLQLDNLTRSDNNGQTLEYQIISNQKIPKK
ncbi:hypothetical protein COY06_02860 [Candidatus Peregrinibacteria bacterium CG_4_10_14_0_2_um_filter_41_8]|nr:MAG: hypothetical protein COY06_02860 [Candidatus Peregrinibacteria bacterium CG_4_10_14_0_2_um_filter_41_8]